MRIARWRLLLLVLVGVVTSAGGSLAWAQKVKTFETDYPEPVRLLKMPALKALREPDRLEALPVRIEGVGLSSTFHVVETPIALDAQTMGNLRKTLLNARSYGGMTACMFDPAVALRFHKGAESVQIVICFKCGELIFQDAAGRDLSRRLTFHEIRAPLLAAARKAFPKDKALQSLH
jgi:hypothetical protein